MKAAVSSPTAKPAGAQPPESDPARTIGLWSATGVGVGAIVGGGVMVLAGAAFAVSGPSAVAAFALNGVIAFLTAASYAEVATAFPESGGTYTFAKKVLSVRTAFAVGWILWFAYIVAAVLYALGFATYAALGLAELWHALGAEPPAWVGQRGFVLVLATAATVLYAASLVRKAAGGGELATIGKVLVFAVIIVAGAVALARSPLGVTEAALEPFFDGGTTGLLTAAGFTFIAAQGFDLIPAIGGEIQNPRRNIPRSMFLSLAIAMAVYLPLLLVIATAGVAPGERIRALASTHPDTVFAVAVKRFMGVPGYWLVILAAVLSTLSALLANLLAASRVAQKMARDRTLPGVLRRTHPVSGTPTMAIYASALTVVALLAILPDLGAAGAAASLIFLVSFLLAHVTAYLTRRRGGGQADGFRTPLFPLVPAVGALTCGAMAVFQALQVPDAGHVALIWLGVGVLLYFALFKTTAETADASAEGQDPRLAKLRGKSPLVLLPIANPANARGMVEVANAIAPSEFARVLLLSIVRTEPDGGGDHLARLRDVQEVVTAALSSSYAAQHAPEALITAAPDPWKEIRRVAIAHGCQSLLVGLGMIPEGGSMASNVEELMNDVDCDVAVMSASPGWSLDQVRRILVPVAGRGEEHGLRARVLASVCRDANRELTFVTVLPGSATDEAVAAAARDVGALAEVKTGGHARVEVLRHDSPVAAILEASRGYDLLVLGLGRAGWGRRTLGDVAVRIAREAACPSILLSSRSTQLVAEMTRPLKGVLPALPLGPGRRTRDESR